MGRFMTPKSAIKRPDTEAEAQYRILKVLELLVQHVELIDSRLQEIDNSLKQLSGRIRQ